MTDLTTIENKLQPRISVAPMMDVTT